LYSQFEAKKRTKYSPAHQDSKPEYTTMSNSKNMKDVILNCFEEWDSDRNGYITQIELMKVLVKIGVSKKIIPEIFKQVDKDHNGKVDYKEFLNWVYGKKAWAPQAVQEYITRDEVPQEALEEFLKFLLYLKDDAKVLNKYDAEGRLVTNTFIFGKEGNATTDAVWEQKYKKLKDLFDACDPKRIGKISLTEFKACVSSLGSAKYTFLEGDVQKPVQNDKDHLFVRRDNMLEEIFHLMDVNHDKIMTFEEFEQAFNTFHGL